MSETNISSDALDQMTLENNGGAAVVGELDPTIKVPKNNIYTIIEGGTGNIAIEALGDQIIIVQDKYKTGFECKTCDGVGHKGQMCKWCAGTGIEPQTEDNPRYCRKCGQAPFKGYEPCEECRGLGGLLVAPEIAQRKPTTGVITSIGPNVKILQVGDRVLFGTFAGQEISFKQKAVVRIAHEHEMMCRLHGTGKVGDYAK